MDELLYATDMLLKNADLLPSTLESELWLFHERLMEAEEQS